MDLSRMSLMMVKVMKGGNKGTRFCGFGGMWDRIDSILPLIVDYIVIVSAYRPLANSYNLK
jgi:hypothetical protein